MAAIKATNSTFDEFQEILKRVKEGVIEPFYILYGEETFFKEELIKKIKERIIPIENRTFNYNEFIANFTPTEEIFKHANRNQLIETEYTLTVVKNAENVDDWSLLRQLFDYPKNRGIIILEFKKNEPKKREQINDFKAIFNIVLKQGVIFNSAPIQNEKHLKKVIDYMTAINGCKIESEAAEQFIELFGGELSTLENEIRKIASFIEKKESISLEYIKELKPLRKYKFYELTNALVNGDINQILAIAYYLAANEETNNVLALNKALYNYFQKILLWGVMQNNKPTNELIKILGLKDWQKDSYIKAAKRFPPQRSALIIARLRKVDLLAKTGGLTGEPYEKIKQLLVYIITT
jgi:DNA polymerase III, delta subunit